MLLKGIDCCHRIGLCAGVRCKSNLRWFSFRILHLFSVWFYGDNAGIGKCENAMRSTLLPAVFMARTR